MTEKLTILELNAARELLHRADMLVADARSLFFGIEDCTTVARLKNIERRLQDEVQSVERLMASEDASEAAICRVAASGQFPRSACEAPASAW